MDVCVAFAKSLSSVPSTSSLSTVSSQNLSLQSFLLTLLLCSRGSLSCNFLSFSAAQSSYSQGTLYLSEQSLLLE